METPSQMAATTSICVHVRSVKAARNLQIQPTPTVATCKRVAAATPVWEALIGARQIALFTALHSFQAPLERRSLCAIGQCPLGKHVRVCSKQLVRGRVRRITTTTKKTTAFIALFVFPYILCYLSSTNC